MLSPNIQLISPFEVEDDGNGPTYFIRCNDCGARVHFPMKLGLDEFAKLATPNPLMLLDPAEFVRTLSRHVELNPDAHPTMWVPDVCSHKICKLYRFGFKIIGRIKKKLS